MAAVPVSYAGATLDSTRLGMSRLDSCFGRIVMYACMCSSWGRVVIVMLVAVLKTRSLVSACISDTTKNTIIPRSLVYRNW